MAYTKSISFFYDESKAIWKLIERASLKSHFDCHRVFRDLLTMSVCALSRGEMEDKYAKTVKGYGEPGGKNRAIDAMAEAFGIIVSNPGSDLLGDVFQGAITFGEAGQFFTPEPVCRLMSLLSGANEVQPGQRICDPACGSGRTLLAVAEVQPSAIFYGTDVDARCAMMTAINLAIRGLRGIVTHGNTLTLDQYEQWYVLQPGKVILPRERFVALMELESIADRAKIQSPRSRQLSLFS